MARLTLDLVREKGVSKMKNELGGSKGITVESIWRRLFVTHEALVK